MYTKPAKCLHVVDVKQPQNKRQEEKKKKKKKYMNYCEYKNIFAVHTYTISCHINLNVEELYSILREKLA